MYERIGTAVHLFPNGIRPSYFKSLFKIYIYILLTNK